MKKISKQRVTAAVQVIIIVLGIFGAYYYFTSDMRQPQPVQNTSNNWKTYSNETNKYQVGYPDDVIQHITATESSLLNPNKTVQREKFTVLPTFTKGTNLSADSGLIIEVYSGAYLCQADYLPEGFENAQTATIKGKQYVVAKSDGAGAGNRYEQTLYRYAEGNICYSLLLNTHTTNIGNYPAGTVQAYDKAKFESIIYKMLDTFKVGMVQ
jgi:hypothetical protein